MWITRKNDENARLSLIEARLKLSEERLSKLEQPSPEKSETAIAKEDEEKTVAKHVNALYMAAGLGGNDDNR